MKADEVRESGMGLLVDGVWQDDVSRTKDGHFVRPTTRFRNWVTPDGSPGPGLYCAVIVKRVDEKTRAKTSVNELLRD